MERRKFVIGLGSLAAGGAAAMGTGAFTSVEADRTATIEVTSDDNAYLELEADPEDTHEDGPDYAENTGEGIEFTIDNLNPDATTKIDDLFAVNNQGTQEVEVVVEINGNNSGAITLDPSFPKTYDVGSGDNVDMEIDTSGLEEEDEVANEIRFEADPTGGNS